MIVRVCSHKNALTSEAIVGIWAKGLTHEWCSAKCNDGYCFADIPCSELPSIMKEVECEECHHRFYCYTNNHSWLSYDRDMALIKRRKQEDK
jgi:hypothetical protein